jgi:hypothetical protein
MSNPQELKESLIKALIAEGNYEQAYRLMDEKEKKSKRPRIRIVNKGGGTNKNLVAQMIEAAGVGGGTSDHGALTGLADDDHTQYHNDTRGDARYYTKSQVDTSLGGKANTSHTHAIADTTGLQTALDGKAATSHNHTIADVTNLQTTLDGKADDIHSHIVADVTGLQTALDGKAATSHTHVIADTTGLQTALDGKAATSHTHTAGHITDFNSSVDARIAATSVNALSDVTISTPANGQVLKYNGSAWVNDTDATGGGSPGGSNTQIQFNDGGSFAGSPEFTIEPGGLQYVSNDAKSVYFESYDSVDETGAGWYFVGDNAGVSENHLYAYDGIGNQSEMKLRNTEMIFSTPDGSFKFRPFQTVSPISSILDFSNIATTDKTFTFPNTTGTIALTDNPTDITVPDEAYGSGWDGSLEVPTKNAVYDKIETLSAGGLTAPQVMSLISIRF